MNVRPAPRISLRYCGLAVNTFLLAESRLDDPPCLIGLPSLGRATCAQAEKVSFVY